jgi:hypothetical protein
MSLNSVTFATLAQERTDLLWKTAGKSKWVENSSHGSHTRHVVTSHVCLNRVRAASSAAACAVARSEYRRGSVTVSDDWLDESLDADACHSPNGSGSTRATMRNP